jgi:hypothetical protein
VIVSGPADATTEPWLKNVSIRLVWPYWPRPTSAAPACTNVVAAVVPTWNAPPLSVRTPTGVGSLSELLVRSRLSALTPVISTLVGLKLSI